jgi:hypothetical protein
MMAAVEEPEGDARGVLPELVAIVVEREQRNDGMKTRCQPVWLVVPKGEATSGQHRDYDRCR